MQGQADVKPLRTDKDICDLYLAVQLLARLHLYYLSFGLD
jgi:hypothetical protein